MKSIGIDVAGGEETIDIGEIWRSLVRRKKTILVTAIGILSLTGFLTTYQRIFKPVYSGSFTLLVTDPISGVINSRTRLKGDETMFEQLARNTTENDIPTLIELLKSPLLLNPLVTDFNISTSALARRIKITSGTNNNDAKGVLKISIRGRDPIESLNLLNALSETYLQAALQQRQQRLSDGLNFLYQQEPELEAKREKIQSKLAEYRRKHSLLEPISEVNAIKIREANIASQILEFEASRNRLLKILQEIENGRLTVRGFQEAISIFNNGTNSGFNYQGLKISDVDQSLLDQLLSVETELAKARSKYKSDSSMVTSLEERLNQFRPLLRKNQIEAVKSAINLNDDRLNTAIKQQTYLKKKFQEQSGLIKEYENLMSRLDIAQEKLTGLVTARENFQLEMAQRSVPWRVIDPPVVDPSPVKPSIQRNLALGSILGLIVGIITALVRDRIDNSYHSTNEVTYDTNLPLLGYIPYSELFNLFDEKNEPLIEVLTQPSNIENEIKVNSQDSYKQHLHQEAFRNLYTSIRFLNTDSPLELIALTSAVPAEGKTLIAILLAKTMAEMGHKVLLIDGDLRKPQIHTRLGIENIKGLTNYLINDETKADNIIQNIQGYENWDVITAGSPAPDPTRLIDSERMNQLLRHLKENALYEKILFDTPPMLNFADAFLLADRCDGLFQIISLDKVNRVIAKAAMTRIISNNIPILGIITNAIKPNANDMRSNYYPGYYTQTNYSATELVSETNSNLNTVYNDINNVKSKQMSLLTKFRTLKDRFYKWLDD